MIKIDKINELYIKIICEKDIAMEIYDTFSFRVQGYQYMKEYKSGVWDGYIRLFNLRSKLLPLGLLGYLLKLAHKNEWKVSVCKSLKLVNFDYLLESFIDKVIPNLILEPYDYQLEAFVKSLKLNRSLVLSPTASGKSFIIYLIIRFLLSQVNGKVLISVPSTNLVKQMKADFCSYEDDRCLCDQSYELLSRGF